MKIRLGFVSNSSSASFLIACKAVCVCPHCGITPPNLLDMIASSLVDRDTEINCQGQENVIGALQNEIRFLERDLADFRHYINMTDSIEDCLSNVAILEQRIEKVKSFGDDFVVADIDIGYHDEYINNLFRELVHKGDVIIISGEDL